VPDQILADFDRHLGQPTRHGMGAHQHSWAIELRGRRQCQVAGPDVIGDVAFEFRRRQAQPAVTLRQHIAGMIAQNQQPKLATTDDLKGVFRIDQTHGRGI